MNIQISFLGKANHNATTGYRTATYCFDDGRSIESAFFGPALAQLTKPDKLIVLGTPGSMWDVLLDAQGGRDVSEASRLALLDDEINNAVTEKQLAPFAEAVSRHMGVQCEFKVISYAQDDNQQADLLSQLASWLSPGDVLTIDVTHGLRHLPMLMLAAAHFLEKARNVTVAEIYYGALDLTQDGRTPVLRLGGLLRLLDWVQAVSSYDAGGDYSALTTLFSPNESIVEDLRSASFFERTMRPGDAKKYAQKMRKHLQSEPLLPPARLFADILVERLSWADEGSYAIRQKELALRRVAVGDFSGAAQMAFEAFISRLVQQVNGNISSHTERNAVKENYEKNNRHEPNPTRQAYFDIRDLRNALSHGDANARGEIRSAMNNEETLRNFIQDRISVLFAN